jgi:hypothetical protein
MKRPYLVTDTPASAGESAISPIEDIIGRLFRQGSIEQP